jgi:cell division protein ZipA
LNELRWILAAIGVPCIAVIGWWSARRSRQAPGNAELREPSAHASRPDEEERPASGAPRDRTPGPLEPLSIRTDAHAEVPDLEGPMSPYTDPIPLARVPHEPPATEPLMAGDPAASRFEDAVETDSDGTAPILTAAPISASRSTPSPSVSAQAPELGGIERSRGLDRTRGIERSAGLERSSGLERSGALERGSVFDGEMPSAAAPRPPATARGATTPVGTQRTASSERAAAASPPSDAQRIVAVRVCAVNEERWPGRKLLPVLEAQGLAFGRYQVFHRRHSDGRSIFCVASLTEPGAFDAQRMADEEYRGVTLFAVLPGPLPPLKTLDEMLRTARDMARDLAGVLQDDRGMPLSPQRSALLREEIAQFQASQTIAASP